LETFKKGKMGKMAYWQKGPMAKNGKKWQKLA